MKKPDFSGCADPEFAEIQWEANQIALENSKNNPFIKASEENKMNAFFTPEDFYLTGQVDTMNTPIGASIFANKALESRAIKGFAQKHRGEWSFTERPMKGDTHNALLLNLSEIEPCAHEVYKITSKPMNLYPTGPEQFIHRCECGQEMEIGSFVEKKK